MRGGKKAQLAHVYCLCDCWWRQTLKKTAAEKRVVLVGFFFVIAAAIRCPDRFPGKAGEVRG